MLTALLTFAAAGALVVLIPGPDTMVMLRSVVLRGRRGALFTAAGLLTGLVIWASAAALGLAALLRASHDGYLALRIVGAVYLITMGIRALRARGTPTDLTGRAVAARTSQTPAAQTSETPAARSSETPAARSSETPAARSSETPADLPVESPLGRTGKRRRGGVLGTGYRAGLATDLLNPKVGVFFVTFLPAFIPHGDSVGAVSAVLSAVFVVETAIYLALMVVLVERITRWLASAKIRRRLDRTTGLVLIGFGVRLVAEG